MSRPHLSCALAVSLLSACVLDAEPLGDTASRAATRCDACADALVIRPWRSRDVRIPLWPRDTRRAAVVITPGATAGTFIAYGVADTTAPLWAYHADARDYADVAAANAAEWRGLSTSTSDFDSVMLGSFNKPKPKGPVVGEPPPYETMAAVLDAAAGAAELNDILASDLDSR